jgi:lysophospholipase L1-like esterase
MSTSSTIHRRVFLKDNSRDYVDEEDLRLVRRKLEYRIARDEDDDASCCTNTWKLLASLLLTSMVLGPFLYTSYNKYHQRPNKPRPSLVATVPAFLEMADQLTCAASLNITYAQIFMDMKQIQRESASTQLCRDPTSEECWCSNPTIPVVRKFQFNPRGQRDKAWRTTFQRNVEMASSAPDNLDVVFMGDSITEQWLGTSLMRPVKIVQQVPELWNDLFGDNALALGMSGDRCNNLLYRLEHGEMPDSLNPTVWWILIGTNDYVDNCNRAAILAGQLAILDTALTRKPHGTFVLQGILPRGEEPLNDESSLWQDFQWINDRLACLAELPQLYFFQCQRPFFSMTMTIE